MARIASSHHLALGRPMGEDEAAQKPLNTRNIIRGNCAERHGCTTQKLRQPKVEFTGLPAPANMFSHLNQTELIEKATKTLVCLQQ